MPDRNHAERDAHDEPRPLPPEAIAPPEHRPYLPDDVAARESMSREGKQRFAARTRRGPAH